MFMLSFRITKRKTIIYGGIIAALVLGSMFLFRPDAYPASSNEINDKQNTEEESKEKVNLSVKNNEERLAFIKHFGWDVTVEPSEIVEVIIPKEFDTIYQKYNEIQTSSGFNLEKHRGKRVKKYCYNVINYPDVKENVSLTLLVHNNKVIGGDISLNEPDGFSHAL